MRDRCVDLPVTLKKTNWYWHNDAAYRSNSWQVLNCAELV